MPEKVKESSNREDNMDYLKMCLCWNALTYN